MNKVWTHYNFGRTLKKYSYIVGIALILCVTGCAVLQGKQEVPLPSRLAWLQDTPVDEILPTQLTCESHPEMVDGNLETVGTFEVKGTVTKKHDIVGGAGYSFGERFGKSQYVTELDGTIRCEILIKLEKPMYVSTIEVYPASHIPNLALSTSLENSEYHPGQSGVGFKPVHDKQYESVENTKPVKFHVEREILYLRVTADALEDRQDATRIRDEEIDIPLKGAAIREVKLYGKRPL